MSQAITLAERQRRLQIRLTSPIPDRYQGHGCVVDLVRGHEAAIRLVDASNYVCHCCPAPGAAARAKLPDVLCDHFSTTGTISDDTCIFCFWNP